jgi:FkbM family methyltransferase
MRLYQTVAGILRHPLNRGRATWALSRFVRWQVGSRLRRGPHAVPFVDDLQLLVSRGMTGATGNIYCGLIDAQEMGFVLHALRPGDLFLDVGANVGSYTVLAAATGARVIAFEPVPATFRQLQENIRINRLDVAAHCLALGAAHTDLLFTTDADSVNHALAQGERCASATFVPVRCLDDYWPERPPEVVVLKLDVEGFEAEVMRGGERALHDPAVKAVILELLNGASARYGFDDWQLHDIMLGLGFWLHRYDPLTRVLQTTDEIVGGNNLYVRDAATMMQRVRDAPRHRIHGLTL